MGRGERERSQGIREADGTGKRAAQHNVAFSTNDMKGRSQGLQYTRSALIYIKHNSVDLISFPMN